MLWLFYLWDLDPVRFHLRFLKIADLTKEKRETARPRFVSTRDRGKFGTVVPSFVPTAKRRRACVSPVSAIGCLSCKIGKAQVSFVESRLNRDGGVVD
jgi:hypothetical protein